MLAGGMGVYAGSTLSPLVDVALFRRLLILLMLLGANIMLFAGTPGRVALSGVLSILALLVLFILALWHQPFLLAKGNSYLAAAGLGGEGGVESLPQRWLGKLGYSQVATREEEEEGEEETDGLLVDEAEGKDNAVGANDSSRPKAAIEMVAV